jgi:allantoinase
VITIRAARVVTPDGERPAAITIRDGHIVSLTDPRATPPAATVVDIPDDNVVLPGLVDSHVHVNEPGRTEWEGFATATAAAAAGGVTTIVDMPLNSVPATVDVDSLRTKQRAAAGQLAVDVAFWGGAVPGNAARLRELHEAGVVGFKCFLLPSGVPEFPPLDRAGLALAMRTIAEFDGLLIAHAEDPELIDAAPLPRGRLYADFVASRPDAAEARAVTWLLEQTRATGCRTHVVHLSSAASLPAIRAAKAEGLPVTVETCPHYLTLRAENVPDGATQFKCCPPIRGDANREPLWEALRDGTIDCVVSDHSPCVRSAKRLDTGDFGEAWGGIASVQLGLPVMWTHAREHGVGLTELARWMCNAPAALVGLTDRGRIAPGMRADLCVFAPDEYFEVDPRRLRHRNPISPYAGRLLRGVVRRTWLRGLPVELDGPRFGQMVEAGGSAAGATGQPAGVAGRPAGVAGRPAGVAGPHNGGDD